MSASEGTSIRQYTFHMFPVNVKNHIGENVGRFMLKSASINTEDSITVHDARLSLLQFASFLGRSQQKWMQDIAPDPIPTGENLRLWREWTKSEAANGLENVIACLLDSERHLRLIVRPIMHSTKRSFDAVVSNSSTRQTVVDLPRGFGRQVPCAEVSVGHVNRDLILRGEIIAPTSVLNRCKTSIMEALEASSPGTGNRGDRDEAHAWTAVVSFLVSDRLQLVPRHMINDLFRDVSGRPRLDSDRTRFIDSIVEETVQSLRGRYPDLSQLSYNLTTDPTEIASNEHWRAMVAD